MTPDKDKLKRDRQTVAWLLLLVIALLFISLLCGKARAEEVDTTKWANAIFKAEGGYNATYLYGIRSIPYDTEGQARHYCQNTVYNTLVKFRSTRCVEGESDIDCLSRRYCPQDSDTDNGTCKYWKKNVQYFLNNPNAR